MTRQDDAQFADLDRYIRLQLGEAAAQLATRTDIQATLSRMLHASNHSDEHGNEADATTRE